MRIDARAMDCASEVASDMDIRLGLGIIMLGFWEERSIGRVGV